MNLMKIWKETLQGAVDTTGEGRAGALMQNLNQDSLAAFHSSFPFPLREALTPASPCHPLWQTLQVLQQEFLQLCRMETACVYTKTEISKTCWSNGALPLHWDQAETQVRSQWPPITHP